MREFKESARGIRGSEDWICPNLLPARQRAFFSSRGAIGIIGAVIVVVPNRIGRNATQHGGEFLLATVSYVVFPLHRRIRGVGVVRVAYGEVKIRLLGEEEIPGSLGLPDLHTGGEGKPEGRGLARFRSRLEGSRPSGVALSIYVDFEMVARVRRQPLDNTFEWASWAFSSRIGDCRHLPLATFGRTGTVRMIGIFAFRLGRSKHPQSNPIRLNGSDEWPGDTVRDCMEGRKRK